VTGIPLKFVGTGEKLDAMETFDPGRLASRILGMGDIVGLIEKAESSLDQKMTAAQVEMVRGGNFDLEDWLDQMRQLRKMGPLGKLTDMLPGRIGEAARQQDPAVLEAGFRTSEAIINSMTREERQNPSSLNASRRRRIAAGSGTAVQDVNRLMKQFLELQKMMKTLKGSGGRGLSGLFRF
jgi:signal recognition particle subunit SRP54